MSRVRWAVVCMAVAVAALVVAAPASAAFGLSSIDTTFTNAAGEMDFLAGSHPDAMEVELALNQEGNSPAVFPSELAKDIDVSQVPGLAGDPTAVPPCSQNGFLTLPPGENNRPECPNSSAVGTAKVTVGATTRGTSVLEVPLYSVATAAGEVTKLGFVVESVPVTIDVKVSQKQPYRIVAQARNISAVLEFLGAELTLWGVPASATHDSERGACYGIGSHPGSECPVEVAERPFLTLPGTCTSPLATSYEADSWVKPGGYLPSGEPNLADPNWVTGSVLTHDYSQPPEPRAFEGCNELGLAAAMSSQPTEAAAESPSGLNFDLNIENPGLTEPNGRAGSDIEKAVVTLPEGITTNPAVASGLAACTFGQYEEQGIEGPGGCPEASKIGSVEVETPLLEEEGQPGVLRVLHGAIYVAKQGDNPFHNLLSIYMVIKDPKLGILFKLPGKVEPNAATGQLTTTFDELPQFPFSHFHLHFREGQRAPLITPATCGQFEAKAVLYPYADPGTPVERTGTFTIAKGAGGGGCASSPGALPNQPAFSAGTLSTTAGAYSPFVLHLSRPDGSQQISSISTTLPGGLLGKLAGIPYCPDAAIAQVEGRTGEGQGAQEAGSPSCPASSQIGTVTVAAGAGSEPYYVSGQAYLAGPYKGAPLSLEIITPAIAGPFDLGTVAVRTALQVDPLTAQITAVSDPIPTILHGLPLDVRSIDVNLNRSQFTLNPTSCEPKAITGTALSTLGAKASLSSYFQVSQCNQLNFKPKLQLSLKGSTKRTGHPALKAVLTYPKGGGYANIARAQVNLPHSEFIEQNNLNKTCTKPILLEGKCPAKSVYGKAKAWSPLLEKPLEGNIYLVGGFGFKLPALVAELNGQIRILLAGKVDSGPNKGIRNTFEAVPDAPVEKFELNLKGGPKYSLLVNSENLCKKPQKAITRFTAQNGKVVQTKPLIANDCKKTSKGGGKNPKGGEKKAGSGHRHKATSGGKKHGTAGGKKQKK